MSVRLFVGNLPYDVTEPDLKEFFASVGQVSTVIIPVDRETGKRRGFAFVEFSDQAQAEEATRRFNNQPFRGRNITINEARARESRSDYGAGTRPSYPLRPAGGRPRPGFGPKPSIGNPDFAPNPMENGRPGRDRRSRNFGADAKPSRKRKNNYGSRGEMGLKRGPIRERVGGQFFGDLDEDDDYDEGLELDYITDSKESGEEEDAV
jgi:RNA recognition motif-containing protein